MKATDHVKRAAYNKAVDYLLEDPVSHVRKIMDLLDKAAPDDLFPSQRKAFRTAIDSQNNWYQLIMKVLDLNPAVRDALLRTFIVDANLMAWPEQEKSRVKHGCNIPWAVLMDPTSACNLHCTGCWAAEYGHNLNLSYDELDAIIRQGKELGTHVYIYTGGEPLVRKRDLIRLCEAHPDCAFLSFTNGTLIDEEFCQEMIRVKNFVPAISVEGFEAATDGRRGEGTFGKVTHAFELLREHGLPFGVSCCYTSANAGSIASEEFFDWMIDQGVLFAWIFTYFPVGVDAPTDLMVTPGQREHLYRFVRKMRQEKPLFTLDFQNDGEFVGGCIAGGRRYLHINAAGDVEPCVFAHYANANIRESSLLDALKSPLFMAYHDGQPFNDNLLRPCPILENQNMLAEMVERTGAHSTDLQAKESARDLCAKCSRSIEEWAPVAERLWSDPSDPMHAKRQDPTQGMADSDMDKLRAQGRR
ncbi:radical SAM protein [Enorma massiliensis]|uniref:radical SAM protein n=1 Tax=Enorma massiliensis TaxID=1472761 RepID=UPI0015A1D698